MGIAEKKPVMNVILDKDFISNFWNISLSDKPVIDDFKDTFLKKTKNFCLKTNFSSFEEIRENEEYSVIMEMLFESVPELEFSDHSEKSVWLNNELSEKGGYKFFLIEFEQKECEAYTKRTGFEFICTSILSKCWIKYVVKEIRKSMIDKGKTNDPDVLNSWNDLAFISQSPTNTIIVVDRFILSNKDGQRVQDNLFPMLEAIIPAGLCQTVDILIIAENISPEIFQLINSHFSRFQNSIKIKFSFVRWDKIFMGNHTIHDRHIYTNYYTIFSGPGFNLFNKKKLQNNDGEFNVRFTFSEFNMKEYPYRIELLKNYLSKCKRMEVLSLLKYYPDKINCSMLNC